MLQMTLIAPNERVEHEQVFPFMGVLQLIPGPRGIVAIRTGHTQCRFVRTRMATIACRSQLRLPVRMTGAARDLGVSAGQRKPRPRMVKRRRRPSLCGMAPRAVLTELTVMRIAVTVPTPDAPYSVSRRHMTLRALHLQMSAGQREFRLRVIECDRRPHGFRMTPGTVLTERTPVRIGMTELTITPRQVQPTAFLRMTLATL